MKIKSAARVNIGAILDTRMKEQQLQRQRTLLEHLSFLPDKDSHFVAMRKSMIMISRSGYRMVNISLMVLYKAVRTS